VGGPHVTSILVKDLECPVAVGQEPRTLQHDRERSLRVRMKMIGLPINQRVWIGRELSVSKSWRYNVWQKSIETDFLLTTNFILIT
jgi:hypothetical protein